MRKHIAAIIANALVLSITHPVVAQHSHPDHQTEQEQEHEPAKTQKYSCPMHPEVITDSPGNCPKCGMKLVPVAEKKRSTPNIQSSVALVRRSFSEGGSVTYGAWVT